MRQRGGVTAPFERISKIPEDIEVRGAAREGELYVAREAGDGRGRRGEPLHLRNAAEAEVRVECVHADMVKKRIHAEDVAGTRVRVYGVVDYVGEELDGEVDGGAHESAVLRETGARAGRASISASASWLSRLSCVDGGVREMFTRQCSEDSGWYCIDVSTARTCVVFEQSWQEAIWLRSVIAIKLDLHSDQAISHLRFPSTYSDTHNLGSLLFGTGSSCSGSSSAL